MQTLVIFLGSIALCVVMAKLITVPIRIINKPLADAVAVILGFYFMLYLLYCKISSG
jgi:hypothetical protein